MTEGETDQAVLVKVPERGLEIHGYPGGHDERVDRWEEGALGTNNGGEILDDKTKEN